MLNVMLLPLAAEGGAGATPYFVGGGALVILFAMMAVLLAFGRGREHS
jgi:hypothetical protein